MTHKGVEHNLEIAQLRAQQDQALSQLERATQAAAEVAAEASGYCSKHYQSGNGTGSEANHY